MNITICESKQQLGREAAERGAELVRRAIDGQGRANIIVATGASQFEVLAALVASPGIDWSCVTAFHLDEYRGLPATHPASFRRYLRERFVDRLPTKLAAFHAVDGEAEPIAECERLGKLIASRPIDVTFCGIGENGHLAFNDPPADFETNAAYIVVELDEACRRQQLGEGWFPTLDDVPRQAISMSIRQIMASKAIICTVPDTRKAAAVRATIEGPVTADVPASILQRHAATAMFLDRAAASQLTAM